MQTGQMQQSGLRFELAEFDGRDAFSQGVKACPDEPFYDS